MDNTIFEPNHFQDEIFDYVTDETKGNLMVIAKAGTGKTKTIIETVRRIPPNKSVIVLAFNKSIANELKSKVPKTIEVRTTHSMGFEAVRDFNGDRKTLADNKHKMYKILQEIVNDRNRKFKGLNNKAEIITPFLFKRFKNRVVRTIDHFRNSLMEVNEDNLFSITDKFDIQLPCITVELLLELITDSLAKDKEDTINIDFTDMIYLPTTMLMAFRKFDFIFVDECQDLNESQLRMLLMLRKPTGRIVAVGDEKQAIYQFRGADVNAMEKIKLATKAEQLPLNICYRCPRMHIKMANHYVPDMEPAPGAEDGELLVISGETLYQYIKPGDLAICRNNAPLIRPALALLKQGIKVNIRGQNLRKTMIELIKNTETNDINEMRRMLNDYRDDEVEKLRAKGKNPSNIIDRVNVILEFARESETVEELINYINVLLNDTDAEITFSTIHGAKGLEADNIFFINSFLIPSSHATQQWELQGEKNIMYVALTRAKKKFYFVDIHDREVTPQVSDLISNRNMRIRSAIESVRPPKTTPPHAVEESYVTDLLKNVG